MRTGVDTVGTVGECRIFPPPLWGRWPSAARPEGVLGEVALPHSNIRPQTRRNALSLRHGQTFAERKLWKLLRPFREQGIPFRRQAPIGAYIVDFAWLGGKLVIETDGGQHGTDSGERHDLTRTKWLRSQGFEVLSFWNNEVIANPGGCYTMIDAAIAKRPPPGTHPPDETRPPPQGGR